MTFVLLISKVLQRLTCWSAGSDGSSQRMCTQLNTWLCVPCTAALQLSCDQWTQPPPSNDTFSRRSIFGGTQSVSRWMVFSLQSERQCMQGHLSPSSQLHCSPCRGLISDVSSDGLPSPPLLHRYSLMHPVSLSQSILHHYSGYVNCLLFFFRMV